MIVTYKSELKEWLRQFAIFRYIVRKMRLLHREVAFIVDTARSGWLSIYRRNYTLSRRSRSQKVITWTVDLPPFQDFNSLMDWLDNNSVRYTEGAYCLYIPPQKEIWRSFEPILSAYPPNSGLKILKDLKAPAQAKYMARAWRSSVTRVADWISYRPIDFLRVANYMYSEGIGPRVYDLIEIQTPYNSLSAYVIQHVSGTVPSTDECMRFLNHLNKLHEDQLVPLLPGWKEHKDFHCPDCNGNLIRDEITGKMFYVDFQSFMLRDANQYTCQIADKICQDIHLGNTPWVRGGQYSYQSIPGLCVDKRDIDSRWNLFKRLLKKHGVSLEKSVVFDIGCNAGPVIYSALTDGAAWGVGWDRPLVATKTQKLLLSLGLTRFDIFGQNISSATDFPSSLPENIKSSPNTILFFLGMRKYIGFPDSLKNLPFKYMVYEDHQGESLFAVKNYLKQIVNGWGLRIADMTSYIDDDSTGERVLAILCRD